MAVSQRHQIQVPLIDLQIVKKVRVFLIHKVENVVNVFVCRLGQTVLRLCPTKNAYKNKFLSNVQRIITQLSYQFKFGRPGSSYLFHLYLDEGNYYLILKFDTSSGALACQVASKITEDLIYVNGVVSTSGDKLKVGFKGLRHTCREIERLDGMQ